MTSKWTQATLGSIAIREGYGLVDGPFGSNLPASLYTDEGVPVIRGSNLALGTSRFRAQEFVYVSWDTANRLARSICRPLDIIFTKKGTLGQTGLIPEDGEYEQYLLSSNQMKLTVDSLVADPLFVYYFVSSPDSTKKIIRDSEATGVPKTNVKYLREFPITLPPLSEQRAIANVLGTLDDKIELNRRMNKTLEAMAQAIFKELFVDFGPTRAKAQRRARYLAPEVWDLFPETLDDEEKPVGWQMEKLDELVSLTKGRSYKSAELKDSDVALVTLKSFKRGGGYRRDGLKPYIGRYKPEQVVEPGELAIALTDVTQAADVIGKPAIVPEDDRYETLVASLDVGIVRLRDTRVGQSFISQLLRTEQFQHHAYSHCTGTTVLHLGKHCFPTCGVCTPPAVLTAWFENTVAPITARAAANARENRTLARTREFLLPKLVSGKIRLSDTEKVVETVA